MHPKIPKRREPRYETAIVAEVFTNRWNPLISKRVVVLDLSWKGFKLEFIAKDKLNISAKTKIEWIRIINLQGVEISNFKNIDELNFQIDVSNFKPELYFVNIKTITSFSYLKILIKP